MDLACWAFPPPRLCKQWPKIMLNERRAAVLEKPPPEKHRHSDALAKASLAAKGLRLYIAGVLTGVFLSFIGYLATLPDPTVSATATGTPEQPEVVIPKPRFDFYTSLTEETVEEVQEGRAVEPASGCPQTPTATELPEPYLLQAGSFRQRDDAERRRAELLLLGLEPVIEEISGSNGVWFRVYLGPFESRDLMARARGLTANQNIETLLLKRGGT